MLAVTQTKESDGMCCTEYLILVLVVNREHRGHRHYPETRDQQNMAQMGKEGNCFPPRH